jgi:phosphoglycolate phosphatase-like HAD superfamily hydrolase
MPIARSLFMESKKLRIFDFDDTLVKTNSFIYITDKNGKTRKLTPGQYAVYNEKPGDSYNFTDFEQVKDPTEIKRITSVLRRIVQKSKEPVYILTARASAPPIKQYLNDIGINSNKINIVALASNNPKDKADWIEDKIDNEGYNDIYFADDSPKNVDATKQMLRKKNVKWRVQHIKH